MKKYIGYIILILFTKFSHADEQIVQEIKVTNVINNQYQSDRYISQSQYIQNPYLGINSGGGTKYISESHMQQDSVAAKLFNDGTWNLWGGSSWVDNNGASNYGYAANIFAQTGQINGFSFGGLLTVTNPFFSTQLKPSNIDNQADLLPVAQQVTPQELYVDYQYSNIMQADVGWIGIKNNPWMTYYMDNTLNMVTYQGVLFNFNPGGGWLVTAFAINGAQLLGENGFSGQTMYNQRFDNGTKTSNIGSNGSSGTYAIGATWNNLNNDVQVRIWGYQFQDFANMAYADSVYNLHINEDNGFNFGLQGLIEGKNSHGDILNNNGYGSSINSNMLGAKVEYKYRIFSVHLGYNLIWGQSNAYENGGIVSPYNANSV